MFSEQVRCVMCPLHVGEDARHALSWYPSRKQFNARCIAYHDNVKARAGTIFAG